MQTVGFETTRSQRNYVFMSTMCRILIPIMVPLIPKKISVMVKKELFNYPLLGKTMAGSLVPVDHETGRRASLP